MLPSQYRFWHPHAACAGNVTGCPWVGHANASRIFDSYIVTVGRGATLNMYFRCLSPAILDQ